MRRAFALSVLCSLLAACSGGSSGSASAGSVVPARSPAHTQDAATALPGGDAATALPGANLACPLLQTPGQASCTVAINVSFPPLNSISPGTLVPGLHPSDLTSRYALPSNGSGTVAIIDAYDDPSAESDLATYRTMFGLGDCTASSGCFRKVDEHGGASLPAPSAAWSQEISIDLDMVSAICPHCSILLVEANSASIDDLGTAVDTAANLGALAVSNSYYASEWSAELSEDPHYHHAGIPMVVSAGDAPSPSYPAASPYVVSVGGTTLSKNGGTWDETAWAYGGRGCSAYEPRPSWQNGVTSCATRSAVDLAAIADPQTGVAMFDSQAGGWLVAGGTSVGAPIVAAAYALAGTPLPIARAYETPRGFYDIAPAGYDAATGLGSLDGIAAL